MAADAVILHHTLTRFLYEYNLWFGTECKNGGMTHPILRLKEILVELIVVGHMAIVAMCLLTVGAVAPGGILRCHDMAVYTGFGFIRQVGSGTGNIKKINQYTRDETAGYGDRDDPSCRWFYEFKQFTHSK